ncbi:MAG TPA: coenzyme F420-0:L-glutamate ligase [Solirubrobacteraceae bacterium]|jgi:coenzyme F420-0:L-glutamate ligase/coenzyme F420-1:gamma-L-glutamate ligase|nr:coenzyme F420-0:L-glutamate ligase [Solirubrobacteraceae bacterium]
MGGFSVRSVDGLGEVVRGADLAALIVAAASPPGDGDIVVIAHKVVSKAEGRVRRIAEIDAGEQASELAEAHGKDPRHVQAILDESQELVRAERGILIVRTHHGFVCANAGIDESNTAEDGTLLLLPLDADASARAIRARLRELTGKSPAVLITDSFGRAWRIGQLDCAVGIAGLRSLDDWRGRADRRGRGLHATVLAIADAVAAAADLARAKDSGEPVVVVSGLDAHVVAEDGPGVTALIRVRAEDLFR